MKIAIVYSPLCCSKPAWLYLFIFSQCWTPVLSIQFWPHWLSLYGEKHSSKYCFRRQKSVQDLNNMRVTKLSGLVVDISYEWILVQPLCLISTFSPSSKQPTSVPAGWFLPHCLGGAMRGRNLPQKRRSHLLVPAQGFMLHKTHWGRADQSERRIRGVWRGWCCCFFHPPLPAQSTQKDYGG